MAHDLTTDLLQRTAGPLSQRRAEQIMKTLDTTLIQLYPVAQRATVAHLLPGMTRRRMGARFGLTPKALRSQQVISWHKALQIIHRELKITQTMAQDLITAYLRAHLALMTTQARLSFTEISPDDMVRAYLRALES